MKAIFFIIPLISAFVGWVIPTLVFTLAITPQNLRKWLKELSIPLDSSNIIPFEKIASSITSPEQIQKIMPSIEVHIDDFLNNKLSQEMPMISMFIGEKTIGKLKGTFLGEIEKMLPNVLVKFTGNLSSTVKPGTMLAQKFNEMSDEELTALVIPKLGKIKSAMTLIGVFIGAIAGIISSLLFYFF